MNTNLSEIFRKHLNICQEIECRDVDFRIDLSDEERMAKEPWIMSGRAELAAEEEAVWRKFDNQTIGTDELLREITSLMESYYGKPYPI
jgi:hypothetical protein